MIADVVKLIVALSSVIVSHATSGAVIKGDETTYRVVRGDNLLLISEKLGVDRALNAKENGLDPVGHLRPGQELRGTTRK